MCYNRACQISHSFQTGLFQYHGYLFSKSFVFFSESWSTFLCPVFPTLVAIYSPMFPITSLELSSSSLLSQCNSNLQFPSLPSPAFEKSQCCFWKIILFSGEVKNVSASSIFSGQHFWHLKRIESLCGGLITVSLNHLCEESMWLIHPQEVRFLLLHFFSLRYFPLQVYGYPLNMYNVFF